MSHYFDDSQYSLPIIHQCCRSHSGKHRSSCQIHPPKIIHSCCESKGYKHKQSCEKAAQQDKATTNKKEYNCPVCHKPQLINFNHEKLLKLKESIHFFKAAEANAIWRLKVIETTIRKKIEELDRLDGLHNQLEKTAREIGAVSNQVKDGLKSLSKK